MRPDYVSTVYNQHTRPYTTYPDKLAKYLTSKFGLQRNQKFLEMGFGRGDFLRAFQRQDLEVFGIDICDSSLAACSDLPVFRCEIGKDATPFDSESFDVVFHKSFLEHFQNPEPVMQESLRLLKPGGTLIILVPDWISCLKIYFDDHTHQRPYTTRSVRDLLKISGFKHVKAEIFYQLPCLWKYPFLKIFSKAIQYFVRPEHRPKSSFIRWSVELMVLGSGKKLYPNTSI